MVALVMYVVFSTVLFLSAITITIVACKFMLDGAIEALFLLWGAGALLWAAFYCGDRALKIAEAISQINLP